MVTGLGFPTPGPDNPSLWIFPITAFLVTSPKKEAIC